MFNYVDLSIAFLIALISAYLLTFPIKKLAIKFKIMDFPNHRKIHKSITPKTGGFAIFLGVILAGLYIQPQHEHLAEIFLGALVIIVTGAIDDKYTVRPIVKLSGQLIATSFLISSGLIIDKITIPFFGLIDLGFVSVIITVLWVIGITNAINLIDGLDGLASGVSTIALISMFIMAIIDTQVVAASLCIILIGANIGFLFHNSYPAKIYMGDTGSNFLGYSIAVVSMLGLFKNITLFSFIIPIIVLAVPIFDTLFAIVRRAYNKENIMLADNKHIHYRLLEAGFSHRKTVLIIYGFSALFGCLAILFSNARISITLTVAFLILLIIHIFAEYAGLLQNGKKPVVDNVNKLINRRKRG
ncbi:glycosyltransferase family 4 protein [Virgibacillus sp. DJP39]|uniref:glycosyltransferase family 4 protein n=1 Tax=Virgibacillus sp. DJP39 TaxID=3409790 RepID=UPI003BB791D2